MDAAQALWEDVSVGQTLCEATVHEAQTERGYERDLSPMTYAESPYDE